MTGERRWRLRQVPGIGREAASGGNQIQGVGFPRPSFDTIQSLIAHSTCGAIVSSISPYSVGSPVWHVWNR
jgi:hypothetical protein